MALRIVSVADDAPRSAEDHGSRRLGLKGAEFELSDIWGHEDFETGAASADWTALVATSVLTAEPGLDEAKFLVPDLNWKVLSAVEVA